MYLNNAEEVDGADGVASFEAAVSLRIVYSTSEVFPELLMFAVSLSSELSTAS